MKGCIMAIRHVRSYYVTYEDATTVPDPPTTPPETFTQEKVDALVTAAGEASRKSLADMTAEVDALKKRSQLTAKEKKELEDRVDEYNTRLLSKEELASKDREKLTKKHGEELSTLTSERDNWKTRYTSSMISRSIVDAAAVEAAFSAEQIVAILQPTTRLVENSDADTGETKFEVRVTVDDVKDGTTTKLDLTVPEAVKRMKDLPRYLNLFKGSGSGGLGLDNRGTGGSADIVKAAKQGQEAYREARKSMNLQKR